MYQNEVNEIRAEKLARNANPLALSHATTRSKEKEVVKLATPSSESASEEDNDEEQAQRDKQIQKSLALIAKHFKYIYKPTNNNLKTSSNTRNKYMDTTPRSGNDRNIRQFMNQRTMTVGGARETIGNKFSRRGYSAEKGVPLTAEQGESLDNTNEEPDEKELEAHYLLMAKIQEVPSAESGLIFYAKPLEKVQTVDAYNVFANDQKHIDQPKNMKDTSLMEKVDSNTTPDSSDVCNNDFEDDQNANNQEDERVALANLIANLKLDTDEHKKIQKQLKRANASHTHELNECKSALAESNNIRDRCRSALHN
ncbi:hypothetical protein Tco_0872841 [Tanacetum coccineum]